MRLRKQNENGMDSPITLMLLCQDFLKWKIIRFVLKGLTLKMNNGRLRLLKHI